MAFNFSWNDFSSAFVKQSEDLLTAALNKGVKPSIIADNITVKELNMGSKASHGTQRARSLSNLSSHQSWNSSNSGTLRRMNFKVSSD